MESRDLIGLSNTIKRFKSALSEALNANSSFHDALNGEEPLKFYGLHAGTIEPNEYLADISDILFWHDSEAYLDELERWEGAIISDKYESTLAYLRETDQISVFAGLAEAVKRKRVAPFVGAGLSKSCNFPLWGEAILQLIKKLEGVSKSEERAAQPALLYLEDVKQYLLNNQYLKATQLIYEKDKTQLETYIRNKFDLTPDAAIVGPVNLLPEISDGCIVTTNFDGLIESVYSKRNRPINGYMHGIQSQNQFVSKLIQGERCILKLHGDVSDPATYIFSEHQYNEAYGQDIDFMKPLAKTLRQIFVSHSLLFLGCSLEQDKTMSLFRQIVDEDGFNIPNHYAILPKPTEHQEYLAKENLLIQTKIRPIWYDASGNDHSMLEALLNLLVDSAKGRTRL